MPWIVYLSHSCGVRVSVHCRIIVDNKCEFQHSSSHGDCNFDARLVSKTRKYRSTYDSSKKPECITVFRPPVLVQKSGHVDDDIQISVLDVFTKWMDERAVTSEKCWIGTEAKMSEISGEVN